MTYANLCIDISRDMDFGGVTKLGFPLYFVPYFVVVPYNCSTYVLLAVISVLLTIISKF